MANNPDLSHSSPLVTHARQLLSLDGMMAAGQGDSPEADALRDQMELSWYQMTPVELGIARQLSADLYTLHGDPLVPHPRDSNIYSPGLAAELALVVVRGEYLSALQLMQQRASEISADRAALFRAILYRLLGLPEIGLVFFQQVAEPTNTSESAGLPLLGFLWEHVNADTAVAAACSEQFTFASHWNAL